jgi:filamentous hemagglutinin family protein
MNRIYKIIWSAIKERWIVVSEKAGSSGRPIIATGALSLAVLLSLGSPAFALDPGSLPSGGVIAAGSGTIATSGSNMTVTQTSQKLIADWQSFNIGQSASVRFDQPGSTASALNRIHDLNPSQIMGRLYSNGQMFLLNQSGIVIGKTAQVNVGGLVASSLELSDSDFLGSRYQLKNSAAAGAVLNEGTISTMPGGVVALIAPQVSNTGTIKAESGSVLMASGNKVRVDFDGDGLISYVIDEGAVDAQVSNSGLVKADGGVVVMSSKAADALTSAAVNNSGVVEARTLGERSGKIVLVSDMKSGATVVSGRLDASAPNGGDGGFIETSGAKLTIGDGTVVDTHAASGRTGNWLIDPYNITIASSAQSGTILNDSDPGDDTYTSGATSVILASTLEMALGNGDVTIQSGGSTGDGYGNGDIKVNESFSWSSHMLTLQAHGDITISAPITWTTANLTLHSGGDININALLTCNNGSLDLEPGSGSVKMGFSYYNNLHSSYDNSQFEKFDGRVDFFDATGLTPRSGSGFLTVNGIGYTVITELGNAGDELPGSTAMTLQGLARSGNLNGHFALGAEIEASDTKNWNLDVGTGKLLGFSPIGYAAGAPFTGVFDGLGHTISAMQIHRVPATDMGLFSTLGNSTIRNFNIKECVVEGGNSTGGIAGRIVNDSTVTIANVVNTIGSVYGGDLTNLCTNVGGLIGTIGAGSNVTITDSANDTNVTTFDRFVGGFVGYVGAGSTLSIYNSLNNGRIHIVNGYLGGLVGVQESGTLTITNCINLGDVTCDTVGYADYVGGLVGWAHGTTLSIAQSANYGSINTSSLPWINGGVGGLVGRADSVTISESFNHANVLGAYAVGGLVGSARDVTISNAYNLQEISIGDQFGGGLVGKVDKSITADNAYNAGHINYTDGQAHPGGGILGGTDTGALVTINNTFWDSTVNPTLTTETPVSWGTPKSTLLLKTLSTTAVAGWDIDHTGGTGKIWRIYDGALINGSVYPNDYGSSYPLLRHFLTPLIIRADSFNDKDYGVYLDLAGAFTTAPGHGAANPVPGKNRLMPDGTIDWNVVCGVDLVSSGNAADAPVTGSPYPIIPKAYTTGSWNMYDYDIEYIDGSLTVKPLPLTLQANNATKTYGDTLWFRGDEFTITSGTLASYMVNPYVSNQETLDSVTLTSAGAVKTASVAGGAPYPIEISSAVGSNGFIASNYSIMYLPAALTVNQRAINLSGSRVYNGTPTFTASQLNLGGVIAGDAVSLSGSANVSSPGTGIYTGWSSNNTLALDNPNYTLVGGTVYAQITPAAVTLAILDGTRQYDGTTAAPASILNITNNLDGANLTLIGTGELMGKNVGEQKFYSIGDLVLGGTAAGNYTLAGITTNGSKVTITPREMTISGIRQYDTTKDFNGAVFGTIDTGIVFDKTLDLHETLIVAGAGSVPTANVEDGVQTLGIGSLVFVDRLGQASNYHLTGGTGQITPVDIWLDGRRQYDGTKDINGNVFASFRTGVGAERLTVNGTGEVSDANVYSSSWIYNGSQDLDLKTLVLANESGLASNYHLAGGYVEITPKVLNVSGSRVYDGTPTFVASVLTVDGVIIGETVSLGGGSADVSNKKADHYSSWKTSSLWLGNSNYTLNGGTVSVDITPVNVMAVLNGTRLYDGTDIADSSTMTISITNKESGDDVSLSGFGLLVSKDAGDRYFKDNGSLVLGGADAGNYSLDDIKTNGSYVRITRVPLTISATRQYDGTADFTGDLFGTINGAGTEKLKVTGTGTVSDKNVYAPDGITLNGAQPLNNYGLLTLIDAFSGVANSTNYQIVSGTGRITPKVLIRSAARQYDGTTNFAYSLFGGTFSTGVGGEQLTLSGMGAVADKNVYASDGTTPNGAQPVTGLTETAVSGTKTSNYQLNVTGEIMPYQLYLYTWREYDGTVDFSGDLFGTYDGFGSDKIKVTGTGTVADKNVYASDGTTPNGAQAVTNLVDLTPVDASGNGVTGKNYHVKQASCEIAEKSLTISATRKYNGTGDFTGDLFGTIDGVGSDKLKVIGTGTVADKNVYASDGTTLNGAQPVTDPGDLTLEDASGSGAIVTNYWISDGTGEITPASLTVTAAAKSKIYGDSDPVLTYSVNGLVNGDTSAILNGTLNRDTGESVVGGTYAIRQGTVSAGSNYSIIYMDSILTIAARPITVRADDMSRYYGDANPMSGKVSLTSGSLVNGDKLGSASLSSSATVTTAAGQTSALTPTSQAFSAGSATNYAVSYTDGVLTIAARPITVRAADLSRYYGDANPTSGSVSVTSGSLVNGDNLGSASLSSAATVTTNAGETSALTPDTQLFSAGLATNYAVSYTDGVLTIAARPITVRADDFSRYYGDTNPTSGNVSLTGGSLVNGDKLGSASLNSVATVTTAAGQTSALTPTSQAFSAGLATNYVVSYTDGLLTIAARPITVRADDLSRYYGDANPTSGNVSLTGGSLVNGDKLGSASLSSSATVTTAAGETANLTPTSQAFSTGSATNYAVSFTDGVLTIAARPITVRADDLNRYYGDANPTNGNVSVTSGSLVNGDKLGSAGLSSPATATSAAGETSALTPATQLFSTGLATNYAVSYTEGELSIAARPITIYAKNQTKTYGNELNLGTTAFTETGNMANSELVTNVMLSSANGLVSSTTKDAGKYIGEIIIGGATGSGGFKMSNYAITYRSGDLTIDPRPITLAANNRSKIYGNELNLGTTAFTEIGSMANSELVTNVKLISANGFALSTTKDAGTYAGEIGISDATGSGGFKASNYAITYTLGDLTINPANMIDTVTVTTDLISRDVPVEISDVVNPQYQSEVLVGVVTGNSDEENSDDDAVKVSQKTSGALVVRVPESVAKAGTKFWFPLPKEILHGSEPGQVRVAMGDGSKLPGWLKYDVPTMIFTAIDIPENALPLNVLVMLRDRTLKMEIRSNTGSSTFLSNDMNLHENSRLPEKL